MEPTLMWYKNPAVWAALVASIAAVISAVFACLSNRKSAREMLDIVKADILILVAKARTEKEFEEIFGRSPEGILEIDKDAVRVLLSKNDIKYRRKKWSKITDAAFEELKMAKFEGF